MAKRFLLIAAVWLAFGGLALAADNAATAGPPAPDFLRPDLSGQRVQLAAFRGKWVLLNFWATWCPPCRAEIPALSRWQKAYGARGFQVLGVSMDDDVADVNAFLAKQPVTYPIVMGDVQLAEAFGGVLGLPLSYLIDPQGRIAARYQGEVDLIKLETHIKNLLGTTKE